MSELPISGVCALCRQEVDTLGIVGDDINHLWICKPCRDEVAESAQILLDAGKTLKTQWADMINATIKNQMESMSKQIEKDRKISEMLKRGTKIEFGGWKVKR